MVVNMKIENPVDTVLKFVCNKYPVQLYPRVLEIAAGNGNFSKLLVGCGYQVTAIDPRLSKVNDNGGYTKIADYFTDDTDISSYDLGVALHPYGIHKSIIKHFMVADKSLFMIPCVKICDDYEHHDFPDEESWFNFLLANDEKLKQIQLFSDTPTINHKAYNYAIYK